MQIERLFEIVYILLDRKSVTAEDLASHFGVSKRTILRDVEALSMANIPIYTRQGKGGGIALLDGYVLDKTVLTEEEKKLLLLGLKTLLPTGEVRKGMLSRLDQLFRIHDTSWIEVDFSRWSNPKKDRTKFDLLTRAILSHKAIQFTYPSAAGEVTERKAYPLKLLFQSQSWYISSYCLLRNDYRTFKVNRIISLDVLEEHFNPENYIVPERDGSKENYANARMIDFKASFSPSVAYRLYDEFAPETITRNEDGTFSVEAKLPDDEWLYGYLFTFGENIRITAPESLKIKLREKLKKMETIYEET